MPYPQWAQSSVPAAVRSSVVPEGDIVATNACKSSAARAPRGISAPAPSAAISASEARGEVRGSIRRGYAALVGPHKAGEPSAFRLVRKRKRENDRITARAAHARPAGPDPDA